MTLTLDKLTQYEERLRTEIVERECVLAAINVLRNYNGKGDSPRSLELGPLAMRLIGPMPEMARIPAALPEPAPQPVAPPRYIPPAPKVNQELERLHRNHGGDTRVVKWAVARMTEDFSLTDIAAFLKREDYSLRRSKISVVLTRLKARGEIQEIKRGSGPNPAVFRKPENPIPLVKESDNPASGGEDSTSIEASAYENIARLTQSAECLVSLGIRAIVETASRPQCNDSRTANIVNLIRYTAEHVEGMANPYEELTNLIEEMASEGQDTASLIKETALLHKGIASLTKDIISSGKETSNLIEGTIPAIKSTISFIERIVSLSERIVPLIKRTVPLS